MVFCDELLAISILDCATTRKPTKNTCKDKQHQMCSNYFHHSKYCFAWLL